MNNNNIVLCFDSINFKQGANIFLATMKHPMENGRFKLIISILAVLISLSTAEVFTALTDMEELFETEAVLINNLELYIQAQEQKMDYLRR